MDAPPGAAGGLRPSVGFARPRLPRTQPLATRLPARLERDDLGRPGANGTRCQVKKPVHVEVLSVRKQFEELDRAPTPNSSREER